MHSVSQDITERRLGRACVGDTMFGEEANREMDIREAGGGDFHFKISLASFF